MSNNRSQIIHAFFRSIPPVCSVCRSTVVGAAQSGAVETVHDGRWAAVNRFSDITDMATERPAAEAARNVSAGEAASDNRRYSNTSRAGALRKR